MPHPETPQTAPACPDVVLRDTMLEVPGGPLPGVRLNVRRAAAVRSDSAVADRAPFLLVHGLASNARLWDAVARRLATAGHEVCAVDLRGHGRSEAPAEGHTTEQAAADVAGVLAALGWAPGQAVVAGQSWGANVVLTLAAQHPGVAAGVALVDGGWIRLGERFADFEQCWQALAPPAFDGVGAPQLRARLVAALSGWPEGTVEAVLACFSEAPDGTVRARLAHRHHREILHSMWANDPRPLYRQVPVPIMLMTAVNEDAPEVKRAAVEELVAAARHAQARWYVGAHHDLHAQHPDRAAADLLALAGTTSSRSAS